MPLRRAFTLLEVVVVLALLGLTVALAAPAFVLPRQAPPEPLREVIAAARRAAVRRAEAVTLTVERDGRWTVTSDAYPDSQPVLTSSIRQTPTVSLVLRISALGACLPDEYASRPAPVWDPLACAPVRVEKGAR